MITPVENLPPKQKQQWLWIAAKALEDTNDASLSIRTANAVVKKSFDAFEVEPDDDAFVAQAEKSYQYVDSYEYEERKVDQVTAGYSPVGGTKTTACSNCRFFVSPARCTVVNGVIAPNGLSKMWQAQTVYEPTPIPVVIVGEKMVTPPSEPTLADKIKSGITTFLGRKPESPVKDALGITIIKQTNGELRWFARYSNAWEDKDKELITQAAHKEYVEWVEQTKMYPELWLWHTPGTRFGVADWIDFSDGFAHASGLVDDTPQAKSTVEYLASGGAGELGVSHGFFCAQSGKYINKYRTFEISVLPSERAAAYGTDFNMLGKETEIVMFNPTQRQFLVNSIGEEQVKALEEGSEKSAASLKQLGVEFKAGAEAQQTAEVSSDVAVKELTALVATTLASVNQLTEVVMASKATSDKALELATKTKDETVSDEYLARVAKAYSGTITRPTENASNVVDEAAARAKAGQPDERGVDFFGGMITKSLAGIDIQGAAAAAAGVGAPAVGLASAAPAATS